LIFETEDVMRMSPKIWFDARVVAVSSILSGTILAFSAIGAASAERDTEALLKDALSAAPPMIAKTAMVMDWDGTMLRQGSDAYVCHPTPPDLRAKGGRAPMCMDKTWAAWADAWVNKKPFKAEKVGIAYMLAGDTGASNTDPYAEGPTAANQWVAEGPHLMVLLPDPTELEALSTNPNNGGAYVMWKGTPYAHIMMPVGERPKVSQ
jgi:hypothetical protein